jgi:cytochrome b pre-mRNA-processing protein 6
MSLQPVLRRQYAAIIARWPVDPLRPNLSFAETLSARMQQYFGTHADADSSLPTQNTGSPAPDTGRQALKFDAAHIQNEINILGNLLEDRFKSTVSGQGLGADEEAMVRLMREIQYPVGENMLRPKGNPEYYEKLMKELDVAPQRNWLQSKLSSWKGWIRMN